uniref:C2H2-type domain-containing protein n=1 Tax=Lygus hesperus TaxID=30085 RepID=A0A146L680_LYGHE
MEGVTGAAAQDFGNEEMLKFFIQLISMTKHMVDNVLPDLLLLMGKSIIDTIISQCDDFDVSLHVFMKLCAVVSKKNLSRPPMKQSSIKDCDKTEVTANVIVNPTSCDDRGNNITNVVDNEKPKSQNSAAANNSNMTYEEELIDDEVWKILIDKVKTEFIQSRKLIDFYYCGLCNVRCYDANTWPAHLNGRRHTARSAQVANIKMVCDTCGLQIISDDQHIAMIMESPEHRSFDELITHELLPLKTIGKAPDENSSKKIPESQTSDVKPRSDTPISGISNNGEVVLKGRVVDEAIFKGMVVCPSFAVLTTQIRHRIDNRKRFTACFCRPCDVVCKCKDSWFKHITSPKHVTLMKNKAFNNVLCMCVQCDFGIVASKVIARGYMCYHIENCHQQSTDDIKDEEYMTMQEITPKVEKKLGGKKSGGKVGSSKEGSFKGSMDSVRSQPKDELSNNSMGPAGREKACKNDFESSDRDDNLERSDTPMSYQYLAAQMKSMKDGGPLQGTSRSSSRASLRSPEFKEGSLMKYLDDVCVPPKEGKGVSSKDGNFKKPNPLPTSKSTLNSPKKSTAIDDGAQFSGRSAPYSGRSTPSAALGSREQRGNVEPANNSQQDLSRSSSSASLRGSQSSANRSGGNSSNDSDRIASPCNMEVDDCYRDRRPRSTGGALNKPMSSPSAPSVERPGMNNRQHTGWMGGHQEPPKFMVSEDNDMVAPFIVMLRHKEAKFLANKTYKPFSALCLLCPTLVFRDFFEWFDHVGTHSSSDTENDVDCSFCNSHIYGNVAEIRERLIFHDEHLRIDRLMKS